MTIRLFILCSIILYCGQININAKIEVPATWDELADMPINWSKLKEIDLDWSLISGIEIEAMNFDIGLQNKSTEKLNLLLAKYFILNGEVEKAKHFLDQISTLDKNSPLELIRLRYLSLIQFIIGNNKLALQIISDKRFMQDGIFKHICTFMLTNYLAVKANKNIKYIWKKCKAKTASFSVNYQVWLDNLVAMKLGKSKAIRGGIVRDLRQILTDNTVIRIWLKTGLYLNKEKEIIKMLHYMPHTAYFSKKVRELVGLLYYRVGDYKKAISFIEDLNSSNAQNIKGNLLLIKKKYELAYGHYKLALLKKKNSKNAIDRALPLAWLLGKYDEGRELLAKARGIGYEKKNKLAIETAFFIKSGKLKKANENINYLNELIPHQLPDQIETLVSYLGILEKDNYKLAKSSANLCKSFNGINCWLQLQTLNWENISAELHIDKLTYSADNPTIQDLKSSQPIVPIDDVALFNTNEINELDAKTATIKDKMKLIDDN